jgi:hypothetical protein
MIDKIMRIGKRQGNFDGITELTEFRQEEHEGHEGEVFRRD